MTYLVVLMSIGLIFNFLAVIGLLRFPDVYTRLHAATKCTTFGTIFITVAVIIYGFLTPGFLELSFHTTLILIAILITNPTGAHAISRAAHRSGLKPVKAIIDELEK